MEIFENVILSKNKEKYSSVFTGIQCLFYYLESNNKSSEELNTSFEKFMGAMKYLDIECAKTVWIHLAILIKRKNFLETKAQKYISYAIRKCLDLYAGPAQKGERYYLDGLYNCVNALHDYYKNILNSNVEISNELMECVEFAKCIENYEVQNIWN